MKKLAGIVAGTGAALNVDCGFKPGKVKITNKTTRTSIEVVFTTETSAVANAAKGGMKEHTETVTASGVAIAADGVRTAMTAGHVAQYAGADGATAKGFTIAAAATPNVNGNDLVWEAEQLD